MAAIKKTKTVSKSHSATLKITKTPKTGGIILDLENLCDAFYKLAVICPAQPTTLSSVVEYVQRQLCHGDHLFLRFLFETSTYCSFRSRHRRRLSVEIGTRRKPATSFLPTLRRSASPRGRKPATDPFQSCFPNPSDASATATPASARRARTGDWRASASTTRLVRTASGVKPSTRTGRGPGPRGTRPTSV